MSARHHTKRVLGTFLSLTVWFALGCASDGAGTSTLDAAPAPEPLEPPLEVLLLGDSISIGYHKATVELLSPVANVSRPMRPNGTNPENCQGTTHGVANIERWLAREEGSWDVIHFNLGLHDLKRVDPETRKNSGDPAHPPQATVEVYVEQLARIVDALEATGARLVFATTTPVPEGIKKPVRLPGDSVRYNAAALELMEERGIPVNDLYTFVFERGDALMRHGDVHYTREGSAVLAGEVAATVLRIAGHDPATILAASDG